MDMSEVSVGTLENMAQSLSTLTVTIEIDPLSEECPENFCKGNGECSMSEELPVEPVCECFEGF